MTGNIFVQSWLIWATFHSTGYHFCVIKSSLCKVQIWKMFLKNTFQKYSCSQMFFKIGVITNFLIINKKISVLESLFYKVTGLMAYNFIKKRSQHRCFPVNVTKCLRKAFFMKHLRFLKMVEEFLSISKGGLTWNDLYDSTDLNV